MGEEKTKQTEQKVKNTSIINIIRECAELGAVIVALVVAMACFIGAIGIICSSQKSIQTTTDVISKNGQTSTESTPENAENLLEYKERMLTIQKNSLNNDLLSFIYGVMSTMLVGLCAYFVEKSEKTAREARENVVQIQSKADAIEKTVLDAQSQLMQALEKADQQNSKLQNSVRILRIQPIVTQARMAFEDNKKHHVNDYLQRIEKDVHNLSNKTLYDKDTVQDLINELGTFDNEVEKKEREVKEQEKKPYRQYREIISNAIKHCEDIIPATPTPNPAPPTTFTLEKPRQQ